MPEITEEMVESVRRALVESGQLRDGLADHASEFALNAATDPIRELALSLLNAANFPIGQGASGVAAPVTPEMVQAGVRVLCEGFPDTAADGYFERELVANLYRAMSSRAADCRGR